MILKDEKMAKKLFRASNRPPVWWNEGLYMYTKNMRLRGWIWEFMRRARLKRMVKDGPVEAMMPIELVHKAAGGNWTEKEILSVNWENAQGTSEPDLFFLHPAVEVINAVEPSLPKPDFKYGKFSYIMDKGYRSFYRDKSKVVITVDMGRRNSVIKRDFEQILLKLRRKYIEPERVSPHTQEWCDNKILQVWDLRQYGVIWRNVSSILDIRSVSRDYPDQPARNAHETAKNVIDKSGWRKLALYDEEDPVSST
jgi:hypothetical protein